MIETTPTPFPNTHAVNRIGVVYVPPPGSGGSGLLAQQVLSALAEQGREVHALGPAGSVPADGGRLLWYSAAAGVPPWMARYSWLRWRVGDLVMHDSRRRGRWAARELRRIQPDLCYAFAEVGLESLRWARQHGVATVVDSASGHVRHFHDVVQRESEVWGGGRSRSHPTSAMVERVEEEYALAERIRAASTFTRRSMIERGVPASRIEVISYPLDLDQFTPPAEPRSTSGPLRVCYVGMLALHKGFVYLLRAARRLGRGAVSLQLVGGTTDRMTRRLLESERRGLDVVAGPVEDLLTALHAAEVLVLPSLHDGFGFVVAEAMAAGLPVIVTRDTGAADWVEPGRTGWIVDSGDEDALAAALASALDRRADLHGMGAEARAAVARQGGSADQLRRWVFDERPAT